jgi:hypothetical protein
MHRIVSPEPQVGSHAVPRPGKGFTVGYVVPTRIIIYIIRDSVRQCACRYEQYIVPLVLARYSFDSSFSLLWRFLPSRMPQSMDAG